MKIVSGLALVTTMLSSAADAATTLTFTSSAGFSVKYPKSWTQVEADPEKLDVVSPGQRDEGVIIGPRQAELRVERRQQAYDAAKRFWLEGEKVIKGHGQAPPPGNCSAVITENDEGQGPPDRTYALFCTAHTEAAFQITVRYWANDPKWKEYQRVAVATANSLKAKGR
jgi:hypothetical protein